jgi:hypothetical protein
MVTVGNAPVITAVVSLRDTASAWNGWRQRRAEGSHHRGHAMSWVIAAIAHWQFTHEA